jgi:hypothetical protein
MSLVQSQNASAQHLQAQQGKTNPEQPNKHPPPTFHDKCNLVTTPASPYHETYKMNVGQTFHWEQEGKSPSTTTTSNTTMYFPTPNRS